MTTYLVLTVIGDDRPGLVEALAQTIAEHEGNWLESNMSHLAGKFAGILRVSVADQHADALVLALEELPANLRMVIERISGSAAEFAPQRGVRLSLVGNDRPGIVREVSRALAAQHINVEMLETECRSAPMSGEALFHARALLRVPSSLSLDAVRTELERIADDLIVDVSLETVPD
jgi:glycine cleavage system regulatory protein